MKKLKILLILPLIVCILTGCWDQKIYERIGFMLEVGVENAPNGLAVTYASPFIDPDQPGKMIEVTKIDGVTLTREAREKVRLSTSKKLEAGMLQNYLISSELATSGINDLISIFERVADNPIQPYLVIVDGSPRELLSSIREFKNKSKPAVYLKELIDNGVESSYIPDTRIYSYDINYFSGAIDSILPMIKLKSEEVEITGSALFHKDKMVDSINTRQTSMLLALMGKMKITEYICKTINNMDINSNELNGVAVLLKHPKRKIKVTLDNGRPIVNISLSFKSTCNEGKWELDFKNQEIKTNIESKIAANIRDDCMLVLDECQKSGSDPIGIGDILRANYPDYWDKTTWLDAYQNTIFKVDVKVHVDSHGLIY